MELLGRNKANQRQVQRQSDLGLGFRVLQEQKGRFINRDGSFNIRHKSTLGRGTYSLYHGILTMTWPSFYTMIIGLFVLANGLFALLYLLLGIKAFPDLLGLSLGPRYTHLFLFSVQILTTLGANPLHPATIAGNIILDIESTLGLLGFALATALIFARFSNPSTKIIFSDQAVIAPYNGISGFMFRIINGRNNELIEVTADVTVAMTNPEGKRDFYPLPLERDRVLVFPINWTIVHPIDNSSPLYGMTAGELERVGAEILISITALDRHLSKKVYARFSYLYDEVVVGARFVTMIEQTSQGVVIADPDLLHRIEIIEPAPAEVSTM